MAQWHIKLRAVEGLAIYCVANTRCACEIRHHHFLKARPTLQWLARRLRVTLRLFKRVEPFQQGLDRADKPRVGCSETLYLACKCTTTARELPTVRRQTTVRSLGLVQDSSASRVSMRSDYADERELADTIITRENIACA